MDDEKELAENKAPENKAPENKAPVYSQVSIEYIEKQTKKAQKKGLLQGILITFLIFALSAGIITSIKVITMIKQGTLYSKTMGSLGDRFVLLVNKDRLYSG